MITNVSSTMFFFLLMRRSHVLVNFKVAAIGLKPSEHLGKDISEMKSHLLNLKEYDTS